MKKNNPGISCYLDSLKSIVDRALDKYLPGKNEYPSSIHSAMRYSVFAGGKRIRPILTLSVAKLLGKDYRYVIPAVCAIEMIHTYSLIHDDLPCMDDDDYRRGRLTCHKVYGEAIATLAGDSLLTLAFKVFLENSNTAGCERTLKALADLAKASGTYGMIGGQVVDIESENKDADLPVVQYIHTHKTGALICSSVRVGAILSGAKKKELYALTKYGEYTGLAFQIIDDCLNVEGDEKKLGKRVGSDLKKKKATYPAILGVQESKKRSYELCEEAKNSLKIFGEKAKILKDLADFIIKRDK